VLTITAQPRAAAASVQASAQPRSPSLPPWWDGRSTIHNDRKCVGSSRVAGLSGFIVGPKNTSRIQTNRISTVPLTGLRNSAPVTAPTAR